MIAKKGIIDEFTRARVGSGACPLNQFLEKIKNLWTGPVHWANDLMNKKAFPVHNEALRHAGYSVKFPDLLLGVQQGRERQIHLLHKGSHRFTSVPVYTNRKHFEVFTFELFIKLLHGRHLIPARGTPRGPDIDQNHLAYEVGQADLSAIQIRKREIGRRSALLKGPCKS